MFVLMKRMFMTFLCIICPWIVLLISDNPVGALFSLILQITVVGWPFASVWAYRSFYPPKKETAK